MPTDPTLVAALRDANAGQLVVDSEDMARMAKDVNQAEPGFVAVFPHDAKMFNRLAALALAASRVEQDENVAWTMGFPNGPEEGDSFIAALAALLEDAP